MEERIIARLGPGEGVAIASVCKLRPAAWIKDASEGTIHFAAAPEVEGHADANGYLLRTAMGIAGGYFDGAMQRWSGALRDGDVRANCGKVRRAAVLVAADKVVRDYRAWTKDALSQLRPITDEPDD